MLLLLLLLGFALSDTVKTKYGSLKGGESLDVRWFKGVPYASPPLNSLRFAPPQAPSAWNGTRDATQFASDCLQWDNNTGMALKTSEDCLYLNIWTPKRVTKKLRTMMFFFGGSWSWGGTAFTLYNAERILKKFRDVIVVTVNYRLGALGFLAGGGLSGNFGILDQRQAMKWVHENIASFGGDPTQLTIWGESAGGGSVSNHLVMPNSWPFFQQAIIESGPTAVWVAKPMNVMQEVFDGYLSALNCSSLSCLRQVDASKLMSVGNVKGMERAGSNVSGFTTVEWGPVVDGVELTDFPINLIAKGQFSAVPLLIGTNLNEGTELTSGIGKKATEAEYQKWILTELGPVFGPKVAAQYPSSQYRSPWWAATQITTDAFMACPSNTLASAMSAKGVPVYLYQFTHVWDEIALDRDLGVFHGSELLAVFGFTNGVYELPDHTIIPIVFSPREHVLIDLFMGYWTSFGASGSPNGEGTHFHWPRFNTTTLHSINLDLKPTIVTGAWRENFIQRVPAYPEKLVVEFRRFESMWSPDEDRALLNELCAACERGETGSTPSFLVSSAFFGWREREGRAVVEGRSALDTYGRYVTLFLSGKLRDFLVKSNLADELLFDDGASDRAGSHAKSARSSLLLANASRRKQGRPSSAKDGSVAVGATAANSSELDRVGSSGVSGIVPAVEQPNAEPKPKKWKRSKLPWKEKVLRFLDSCMKEYPDQTRRVLSGAAKTNVRIPVLTGLQAAGVLVSWAKGIPAVLHPKYESIAHLRDAVQSDTLIVPEVKVKKKTKTILAQAPSEVQDVAGKVAEEVAVKQEGSNQSVRFLDLLLEDMQPIEQN